MNRRTVLTLGLVAAVGASALSLNAFAEKADAAKAPAFTLKAHDGSEVSLADFSGKVVVLEWFNDGCPVWKQHHSSDNNTMVDLAAKYADKNVVWLAVNSTHSHDVAHNAKAAEKYGLPYAVLDDSAGDVGKAYGARTTPHMFVINPAGEIAYNGAIEQGGTNYVDQAISEILAGKPVSTPRTKPTGCGIKYKR